MLKRVLIGFFVVVVAFVALVVVSSQYDVLLFANDFESKPEVIEKGETSGNHSAEIPQ